MGATAVNQTGSPKKDPWSDFHGFLLPQSNTTYTPNQFFDVVLRDAKTTGVVRAVAYVLRKTLGWSNRDGSPQETEIISDYRHLVAEAGISRASIQKALRESLERNYLRCLRAGIPDRRGQRAVSALYELAWDDREEYVKEAQRFQGFFSGEGNRTYIPNQFFDLVVPNENLSVIKVIGAIVRRTIGFQNRYGNRRQEVSMSVTHLMRVTQMERQAIRLALKRAMELDCIVKIKEGCFDRSSNQNNLATTYGLKWAENPKGSAGLEVSGSEITTGPEGGNSGGEIRTGSKITTRKAVQRSPSTGSEITTKAVQDSPSHRNNTPKITPHETTGAPLDSVEHDAQEGVVVFSEKEVLRNELLTRGVASKQVSHLVEKFESDQILTQIEAFDFKLESGATILEPGAYLYSAIVFEDGLGYSLPSGFKTSQQRRQEAQEKKNAEKERLATELRRKAEMKRLEARKKDQELRIERYLKKLPEDERDQINREALALARDAGFALSLKEESPMMKVYLSEKMKDLVLEKLEEKPVDFQAA